MIYECTEQEVRTQLELNNNDKRRNNVLKIYSSHYSRNPETLLSVGYF